MAACKCPPPHLPPSDTPPRALFSPLQPPLTGDRGSPCMTECSQLCSNSHSGLCGSIQSVCTRLKLCHSIPIPQRVARSVRRYKPQTGAVTKRLPRVKEQKLLFQDWRISLSLPTPHTCHCAVPLKGVFQPMPSRRFVINAHTSHRHNPYKTNMSKMLSK